MFEDKFVNLNHKNKRLITNNLKKDHSFNTFAKFSKKLTFLNL